VNAADELRIQESENPPWKKEIRRNHQLEGDSDATSDYWDTYRDSGRFGSHPSHDNYGDESMP
jgi:hypothetical protein